MSTAEQRKPLGRKCYGSIGHLPNSRLGQTDSCVTSGQARICTERIRDRLDTVIVQEKLDGSNVGAARIGDEIIPLTRAGYRAETSPWEQHHIFAKYVHDNRRAFLAVLNDGERLCGEWLAQAHGTKYDIRSEHGAFFAFDIMRETTRLPSLEFIQRIVGWFNFPQTISVGMAVPTSEAMRLHEERRSFPDSEIEGVVYRVERNGKVDFLAKYVRPDKIDGKYLPEISGDEAVWNWRPLSTTAQPACEDKTQ